MVLCTFYFISQNLGITVVYVEIGEDGVRAKGTGEEERLTRQLSQLFYRARHDGPVMLGWRHPWEH